MIHSLLIETLHNYQVTYHIVCRGGGFHGGQTLRWLCGYTPAPTHQHHRIPPLVLTSYVYRLWVWRGLPCPKNWKNTSVQHSEERGSGLHGKGLDGPCKGFWISFSVQPAATEGFKWEQWCYQVDIFPPPVWPWSGEWMGEVQGVCRGLWGNLWPCKCWVLHTLYHLESLSDGSLFTSRAIMQSELSFS